MSIRPMRSMAVLGACALWVACAKAENKTDTTVVKTDTTAAATTTPAPAPLTDANIAALLDEANMADSAWGNLASTKGTAASVKDFGRMMMRDHHSLRKQGQDLAKKLNLTPAAPANDTLPAAVTKMGDSLNAQAKGAAWDKAYIDHEVAVHQSVLSLLQAAQGAAQDTSLKALITKATPNVQAHLTKAQDIQSKLAAAPAAPAAADSTKKKP
jgi:putative membrane protein